MQCFFLGLPCETKATRPTNQGHERRESPVAGSVCQRLPNKVTGSGMAASRDNRSNRTYQSNKHLPICNAISGMVGAMPQHLWALHYLQKRAVCDAQRRKDTATASSEGDALETGVQRHGSLVHKKMDREHVRITKRTLSAYEHRSTPHLTLPEPGPRPSPSLSLPGSPRRSWDEAELRPIFPAEHALRLKAYD